MVEDKNYVIGSRIECDGYRGTLKYVGPVGDTKGQWLGIDWDDPTRGKHNGTYEGREYFVTWHPTSGSFIRMSKAKFGISCPHAIEARYGLVADDELAGIDRENLASLQKEINAPFLEMVGFAKVNRKQSKFDQLKIVCLREQCIGHAGQRDELRQLCPNVEELDLSKNLLSSWKTVADICCQLGRLNALNVSGNYLPVVENLESLREAFPNVRNVTMARMNYNWSDIERCILMFPAIRELSVSFNVIERLNVPLEHSNLANISRLTLEGNLLSQWEEVLKLGRLMSLEYLNINGNKIESIKFPTVKSSEKTSLFPALRQLHISENSISDWKSISELEKLICLEDLKFRENPVLQSTSAETGRQMIIARISKLKTLNSTEIWYEERRGAEYDYLNMFARAWIESESNADKRREFIENHPRFPSLVEKYGTPDIRATKINAEMVSNVITVEFLCPDDPSRTTGIKRKVLKDMEVQKVTGLVQRLFKTGGKIPILSFIQQNLSTDEIPLNKPLQKLSYYSIQDGDKILVRW